jgi:hypothetical protein
VSRPTTSTATVAARSRWSATGIRLEAGARYELRASGTWFDRQIECGPDGYPSPNLLFRLVAWLRRHPRAPWFALIGTVDRRHRFRIGSSATIVAPAAGELVCYANDLSIALANNRGDVELTVTRLP